MRSRLRGRSDLPAGRVTFLFTDIEGSTRLVHALGDRYAQVLTDYRRLLRAAFLRHGGVEVDTQGDSFFVAFSVASEALAAAEEAQRALVAHEPCRGRSATRDAAPLTRPDPDRSRLPGGEGRRLTAVAGRVSAHPRGSTAG